MLRRLLRFFFKHFYHSLAWSYDLVAATVSLGRWNEWVWTALPFINGPTVLEIGHGPGHLQIAMQKKGLRVYGIDESRQMGRQAARRIGRQGLCKQLVCGYAQTLPFGESFNDLVATFPSDFIVDPKALREFFRVLVPGGRLVALPMAWISGHAPADRAAAWLFRVTGESAEDRTSFEERIKAPFAEAGFQVAVQLVEVHASTLLFILATKPQAA